VSVGDTVHLRFTGGLTGGAGSRYLWLRTREGLQAVTVTGRPRLAFTFRSSDIPDVVVNAVRFNGHGYEPASWETAVPFRVADRALRISVTPDQRRYRPGERASLTIRTADASGRPVVGTQRLVDASPPDSLILLYSNLSSSPAQIMPHSLWNHNHRVEGFYLPTWASRHGILKILSVAQQVQKLASSDLRVTFQKRIPLASAQEGLELYQKDMTAGKILLVINPNEVSLDAQL
jgi:hypothetical protein